MHRKVIIALLIACIVWFWRCERSPAREELEQMNVKYSKHEFIKRVKDSDCAAVKLFLTAGMNPNSRDEEGLTALMCAALEGNIEIVSLLVEHGADVSASNRGATALYSATGGMTHGEEKGRAEVIRFLVEHGADVNTQPKYSDGLGETALMNAVLAGNLDIVRFLVEHGADVNAKMYQNRTALTWAAQEAPPEVVQYLLEHGADPDIQILDFGGTALTIAEDMNRAEVVKLLKEAGAKEIKK